MFLRIFGVTCVIYCVFSFILFSYQSPCQNSQITAILVKYVVWSRTGYNPYKTGPCFLAKMMNFSWALLQRALCILNARKLLWVSAPEKRTRFFQKGSFKMAKYSNFKCDKHTLISHISLYNFSKVFSLYSTNISSIYLGTRDKKTFNKRQVYFDLASGKINYASCVF